MTRGISEEGLKELIDRNGIYTDLFKSLLHECEELSPWHPIETIPHDRQVLVYSKTLRTAFSTSVNNLPVDPVCWMEMPEDPL